MVHVRVHRPLREHHVGMLGSKESPHRVHVRPGHFGRAVDLAEEHRFRTHDLAGGLALGGTNPCRLVQRFAGDAPLAPREIHDRHGVPERRVPRQRPATPRLWIVRMPADTNDRQTRGVGPGVGRHQGQRGGSQ